MITLLIAGSSSVVVGAILTYCLIRADFEGIQVDRNMAIPAGLLILGGLVATFLWIILTVLALL